MPVLKKIFNIIKNTLFQGGNASKDKSTTIRVSQAYDCDNKINPEQIFLLDYFSKKNFNDKFSNFKICIETIFLIVLFVISSISVLSAVYLLLSSSLVILFLIAALEVTLLFFGIYKINPKKDLKKIKKMDVYKNAIIHNNYTKSQVPISTREEYTDDNEGGNYTYFVTVGNSTLMVYSHIYSACETAECAYIFEVCGTKITTVKKSAGYVVITSCNPFDS